ncbi:3-(3-hydroxy-phenyl)propionate hydroxylase [Tamaricihabitans halophyticus]|uniref:3-(3-hydroxy-phenyl)propionate hydroxylase n=1 Tax=Tamaricihabitans halophyticus TaxID=1262583 RepID=A0A4R2R337_9PSEU|nr:3-(3-hydroxy-phenyl)propionate hydroxylase [Tamaricihabitans halophyticus]
MIVVGGGPVGMVATAWLAKAGVPVILVEAEPVPKTDWRASTFHAATLELLEELDLIAQMRAEGLIVPTYHFRDRAAGLIAEFDFTLLADETPYPYRLQLNQQHLVRMLYARLTGDGLARLEFGAEVRDVRPDATGVTVLLRTVEGDTELRGTQVIAADGAASTVRGALGIDFDGYTYPERFLIASTNVDLQERIPGLAHVNYVADPEQWVFILRTVESWRAVWPVPAEHSASYAMAETTLQEQFQRLAPHPREYSIVDSQLYNVHQRVAATFRAGNVALVGDAAHINSPIGGVGLNSGIHDAVDVASRIVRIRSGDGDLDEELDTFARIRRQVAVEYVQADTERNTQRLKERDETRRRATHEQMRAIAADPDRAREYMRRVSLLESVRRFGVGIPPGELTAH